MRQLSGTAADGTAPAARCAGCAILIGVGYLHRRGWPSPDGIGVICHGCLGDFERIAERGGDVLATLRAWQRQAWHAV